MDETYFQILPVADGSPLTPTAPVTIGIDEKGTIPRNLSSCFDLLLTTAKSPSREWVSVESIPAALTALQRQIQYTPLAANALTQLLRLQEALTFEQGLVAESLTFSALLGGAEFKSWRQAHSSPKAATDHHPRLKLNREGEKLTITLTRAERRNAVDARLRDELVEALQLPLLDESIRHVELRGDGPCFSSGGDLGEFGTAGDLSAAHYVRTTHPPTRDIHRIASRVTAFLHGDCIGSGIEIPLAAGRVIAAPDTTFRLPEVSMGLVPGAGGTASISHRIGRHRTCFLSLTNRSINARLALEWGLVDEIASP